MNIVFCHGVMGPDENWNNKTYNESKGWKDWLQFTTEAEHDVLMQIPRFPHAHALLMKYDEWEKIMNTQDINADTTLIGHSAGGGFILKYMAIHPDLHVRQIVLVAPWIDTDDFQPFGFYKGLGLNNNIVTRTKLGIDMMVSDDDMPHIISSTEKIMKDMPNINVHRFSKYGHFILPRLPEIMPIIKF